MFRKYIAKIYPSFLKIFSISKSRSRVKTFAY
ncbi:hypothetical protein ES332_A01G253900v1 [Gossypium tomentosum]|uniref:Uncharacterized protein n=1 Tax=Gossypium tomentosum TaxID=34277 RepID=A0A5D2RW31_GOSTO|nr:hypothetical protein ES332_A01G253900v1 [Gossypium tomentosum]